MDAREGRAKRKARTSTRTLSVNSVVLTCVISGVILFFEQFWRESALRDCLDFVQSAIESRHFGPVPFWGTRLPGVATTVSCCGVLIVRSVVPSVAVKLI